MFPWSNGRATVYETVNESSMQVRVLPGTLCGYRSVVERFVANEDLGSSILPTRTNVTRYVDVIA